MTCKMVMEIHQCQVKCRSVSYHGNGKLEVLKACCQHEQKMGTVGIP